MIKVEKALAAAAALQPGAIVAVLNDKSSVLTAGYVDTEHSSKLKPDAIFRISSMTKPITAVALIMLIEKLQIGLPDGCRN